MEFKFLLVMNFNPFVRLIAGYAVCQTRDVRVSDGEVNLNYWCNTDIPNLLQSGNALSLSSLSLSHYSEKFVCFPECYQPDEILPTINVIYYAYIWFHVFLFVASLNITVSSMEESDFWPTHASVAGTSHIWYLVDSFSSSSEFISKMNAW